MTSLIGKCVLDTNVPKIANLAAFPNEFSDVPEMCVEECVDAVISVVSGGGLVLDIDGEIFDEYLSNLSIGGQKGVGNAFVKWVNDNQWKADIVDRVKITKNGNSYNEFPADERLNDFDNSDRKFVATSNAHLLKPRIFQGVDSKWWGWKDALLDAGITVVFVCPEYVEQKYRNKFG